MYYIYIYVIYIYISKTFEGESTELAPDINSSAFVRWMNPT